MAKYELRNKARELRRQGVSVKFIAKNLRVSKGSVSRWVRDIELTVEQVQKLRGNELKGHELGRLKSLEIRREKRRIFLEEFNSIARKRLSRLDGKEFFVAGLALYWGEGGKANRRIEFCNSDPKMIKFIIRWLTECLGVKEENLRAVIGINEMHLEREDVVKNYWSKQTGIPLNRFRKTSFKKTVSRKVYDNFDNYYGTLTILVTKSAYIYYEVLGLIEALYSSKINGLAA